MKRKIFNLSVSVEVANPGNLSDQDLQELAYRLLADGARGKVNSNREDVGLTAVVTPYQVIS